MKTLPRVTTNVSVYQYDKVVLQLEYCQQRLSRQKEEIRRLLAANQRMRLTLNEADPENINPVRFLLHAARHLRASNKFSPAIHLLFKMAKEIRAEMIYSNPAVPAPGQVRSAKITTPSTTTPATSSPTQSI